MKTEEWLYIEPFVYITVDAKKALLYNTLNGKIIEYASNTKPYSLIKHLNEDENLMAIKMPENYQNNTEFGQFIKKVQNCYIGDLLTLSKDIQRPIQLKPIFNIQNDLKTMQESKDLSLGTKIMKEITSVAIQLNSTCDLNCCGCNNYYKQFLFCTKKSKNEINLQIIEKIFDNLICSHINTIHITGGNVLKYSELDDLIKLIQKYNLSAIFYIHYQNILDDEKLLNIFLEEKVSVNLLLNFPVHRELLEKKKQMLEKYNINSSYTFIVENEKDCIFVENLVNELEISNYSIHPFYNKKNMSFFRKNIFLVKNDILEAKPTILNIYARQVINSNYYGNLIIMSNGDVHANLNVKKTGNINKGTLHEFAYKEMESGNSWRKTRKQVKPCNKCIYKFLCPPVSNYEYSIGKFNLCQINK